MTALVFMLSIITAGSALADSINHKAPCKLVEKACYDAGYVRGLYHDGDGKDLDKSCLQPLMLGQSVPGLKLDSETLQKCVEAQALRDKPREPGNSGRRRR